MITEGLPDIIIGKPSFQFDDAAAGASSFSLQLSGESTERLAVISRDVAHRLSSVPGLGWRPCAPRRAPASRKSRSSSIATARRSSG